MLTYAEECLNLKVIIRFNS